MLCFSIAVPGFLRNPLITDEWSSHLYSKTHCDRYQYHLDEGNPQAFTRSGLTRVRGSPHPVAPPGMGQFNEIESPGQQEDNPPAAAATDG